MKWVVILISFTAGHGLAVDTLGPYDSKQDCMAYPLNNNHQCVAVKDVPAAVAQMFPDEEELKWNRASIDYSRANPHWPNIRFVGQ